MKTFIIAVAVVITGFSTAALGEEQKPGFRDIPFGTPSTKVVKRLKKDFGKKVRVKKGDVSLRDFDLGGMDAAVAFVFDRNRIFYEFDFTVESGTVGDLVSRTTSLIYIFKKKYGNTESCTETITEGIACTPPVNVPCVWEREDLGVEVQDRCEQTHFSTVGRVFHKKLAKAEDDYKAGAEKRKLDAATKKF